MIHFIDFDDSFNLNIVENLRRISHCEVTHFSLLDSLYSKIKAKDVICFGPGPGHVDDYKEINRTVSKLALRDDIFLMGICLGHQILLKTGFEAVVKKSPRPMHGRTIKLVYDGNRQDLKKLHAQVVQRYNSWCVEISNKDINILEDTLTDSLGELALVSIPNRLLTMQFHPESVGTSCPDIFFQPVAAFLRYSIYDGNNQAKRNL